MRILLTNDDGIFAPGLRAMHKELTRLGDVTVVAPDSMQSAAAHGITISDPLTVQPIRAHEEFDGLAVAGRPADCVKLAILALLEEPPDLVVSGINDGANVAVNVLYSGTVAAAAEGAILGIPSVAVSLSWADTMHFDRAARIAAALIEEHTACMRGASPQPPVCRLLNINIPDLCKGDPQGVRIAAQAAHRSDDHYECKVDKDGGRNYQLRGWFKDFGPPECDLRALIDGYVVLTPLHFDLTEHERMASLDAHSWPDIGKV